MRALVLSQPGPVASLTICEVQNPHPKQGQVRVSVKAVGLNPVDYKLAGRGNPLWKFPHILGLDVAGIIDEIGEGVVDWSIGDRVLYHGDLTQPGGFAEYAITTAHTIAKIPDSISFTDAAALPCAGLTAYQGIVRRLNICNDQIVWVQGGAGGVGGYGIQICKSKNAKVITTCSSQNKEYVTSLGADHVIDYQTENILDRIQEITNGRGVDAVQSAVDVHTANQGVKGLCFGGGISCIAGLPSLSEETFEKAISIHRIALGGAHTSNNFNAQTDLAYMANELIALVVNGHVDPMITEQIKLEDIPKGLEQLETRHFRGKIVAEIE
jgi:NADPH2:quinone reductase